MWMKYETTPRACDSKNQRCMWSWKCTQKRATYMLQYLTLRSRYYSQNIMWPYRIVVESFGCVVPHGHSRRLLSYHSVLQKTESYNLMVHITPAFWTSGVVVYVVVVWLTIIYRKVCFCFIGVLKAFEQPLQSSLFHHTWSKHGWMLIVFYIHKILLILSISFNEVDLDFTCGKWNPRFGTPEGTWRERDIIVK